MLLILLCKYSQNLLKPDFTPCFWYPLEGRPHKMNSDVEKYATCWLSAAIFYQRADRQALCTVPGLFSEGSWWKRVQRSLAGRGRMPGLSEEQLWLSALYFLSSTSSPRGIGDTLSPQTFWPSILLSLRKPKSLWCAAKIDFLSPKLLQTISSSESNAWKQ